MTYQAENVERIALNIDFKDAVSNFQFKNIYKKIFRNSNIYTIYLNRILEISCTENIRNILDTFTHITNPFWEDM